MKKNKYIFTKIVIFAFFFVCVGRIVYLKFYEGQKYEELLESKTNITITSSDAPRGRILDCNGNVIVDNIGVNAIIYHKLSTIDFDDEVAIANTLGNLLDVEEANFETRVKYYLIVNNGDDLITDEEWDLYENRKLSSDEIYNLKKERVTEEMLNTLEIDNKTIAMYYMMNDGYSYDIKVISNEVSDEVYAQIVELNLPGVTGEILWKRYYPYGDTLKSIMGSLGSIPAEDVDEYISLGYSLNDTVGVSYLEAQYEEYLRGEKAEYLVNSDNTLTLISEAVRGDDLVLSIDINLQIELEESIKESILEVKELPNTEYFKESYAIISDPDTGAIKAMSAQRLVENGNINTWQDITTEIIHSSFTSGSVIKGASMTVGYLNNVIVEDKEVLDACVKLYSVPQKCSWKSLGYVNDITALETSSNYYQFLVAIGVTGNTYTYNMLLNATEEDFAKYRSVFALYGLGTITGIDLPNEQNGIIGSTISDDLLLNLAIGQYDTYTPIQLVQYINTISSNGNKVAPSLMQEIKSASGEVVLSNSYETISHTGLSDYYYERIKRGLTQVFSSGTASGYTKTGISAAGKTGTSETFYDSDGDGKVDVNTISTTLAFYFPSDDPEYSMVIVSPNISYYNDSVEYQANVNRRISKRITEYLYP